MILGMDGLLEMVGIVAALAGAYCFFKGHGDDDDHHRGSGAIGALACAAV